MPQYKVRFTVQEEFVEIVEADNEDDAVDKATEPHECIGVTIEDVDVEKYDEAREQAYQKSQEFKQHSAIRNANRRPVSEDDSYF